MADKINYFGRYLYSLRIRNGYENISDYLKFISLPLSDNYYRDIESGRKRLSFEKAVELFDRLPFHDLDDPMEYYWHYLRDLIPQEYHSKLLIPRIDTSFKDIKNAQEVLEYDLKMHRDASAIARFESSYILSDDEIALLNNKRHYLPIIHYVYMADKATKDDILAICHNNNIDDDWSIIDNFLNVFCVKESASNNIYYKRKMPIFRVPRSAEGINLKNFFTLDETEKSLLKGDRSPESFTNNSTFDYSVIMPISKESKTKVTNRLRDLISEISISDKNSNLSSGCIPFFVSIVISSRENYSPHQDINEGDPP